MQECVSDFIADCNKDVNVCTAMAMSKCLPVLEENEGMGYHLIFNIHLFSGRGQSFFFPSENFLLL